MKNIWRNGRTEKMETKVFENNTYTRQQVMVMPLGEANIAIRTVEGNMTSDDDGVVILTKEAALKVAKHIVDSTEDE